MYVKFEVSGHSKYDFKKLADGKLTSPVRDLTDLWTNGLQVGLSMQRIVLSAHQADNNRVHQQIYDNRPKSEDSSSESRCMSVSVGKFLSLDVPTVSRFNFSISFTSMRPTGTDISAKHKPHAKRLVAKSH